MHLIELDRETLNKVTGPDEGDSAYDGYFCIQVDPFKCTCRLKPWVFIHFIRGIIVWAEKDDPSMLLCASIFKKNGYNPRIIEYNAIMGECVDWEDIPNGSDILNEAH